MSEAFPASHVIFRQPTSLGTAGIDKTWTQSVKGTPAEFSTCANLIVSEADLLPVEKTHADIRARAGRFIRETGLLPFEQANAHL